MCCGYRVLLSAPSLLAIDFTVFVRFIPFYFHQGKLGCQDLLTRNKPLSLSWLSPSSAGCKVPPGSVWQGRRLPAFTCLSAILPVPLRLQVDPSDKPAEDKASKVYLKQYTYPFPTTARGQQWHTKQLMAPHQKAPPSHVLILKHDTPGVVYVHCQETALRYRGTCACIPQADVCIST